MNGANVRVYGALDATFRVDGDAPWPDVIDELYAATRVQRPAATCFAITEHAPGALTLTRDGTVLLEGSAGWAVLDRLVWEVNQLAWDAGGRRVLLHGAAVVLGEGAALLCGASESGKSTLAAALCARGAGYLSDEIVAYDPQTALVDAYAKPISLREGSWRLVDAPEPPPALADVMVRTRYVPVPAVAAAPVAAVVFPSYDVHEGTAVYTVARADALVRLCGHAHELVSHGAVGFRALASLVERAPCIALRSGDLDVACDLIAEAAGAPAA